MPEDFLKAPAMELSITHRYQQIIHKFAENRPIASRIIGRHAFDFASDLSGDSGLTVQTVRFHILPLKTHWTWMPDKKSQS